MRTTTGVGEHMDDIDLDGFTHSHVPLMYDRDGLHCFWVPRALAASRWGRERHDAFYVHFQLWVHYNHRWDRYDVGDRWRGADSATGWDTGLGAEVDAVQDRIFRTHLGLRLDTFSSGGENVVETLAGLLRDDRVPLLPMDMGELPSCRAYYDGHHSGHVTVVTGYRKQREMFTVLDGLHLESLTNARLFHVDSTGGPAPLDPWETPLRFAVPFEPTVTLRQVLGDVCTTAYVPSEHLARAHVAWAAHGVPYLVGQVLTVSAGPTPTTAAAVVRDAASELADVADAVLAGEEPVRAKAEFLAGVAPESAWRQFGYVDSQHILGAAARLVLYRAGANPVDAAACQLAAAAAAGRWRALVERALAHGGKLDDELAQTYEDALTAERAWATTVRRAMRRG